MIPNIVHFIHFTNENSRPFNYVNYLSVKSANDIQQPAYIFVYCNKEPRNNPYWDKMKKLSRVLVVMMDAPDHYEDVSLRKYPQYQADVVRLQRLQKMGGIYLDTDVIVRRKMNELFQNKCAMSAVLTKDNEFSYGSATILAVKGSKFIDEWLKRMPEGLKSEIWAWHASNLPALIAKDMPDEITTLDAEVLMPYHFEDDSYLSANTEPDIAACFEKCKDSYTIHLWETYRRNVIPHITEDYISKADTPLARILREVANHKGD